MSSHFQTVADLEATAGEAEALGERVGAWLVAEGIATAGIANSAVTKRRWTTRPGRARRT